MSEREEVGLDRYRWVMLLLYVLMALAIWINWSAPAPLLSAYWGKVYHINAATGNLLLSLPGLLGVFLALPMGRWIDMFGVRKMMGIGAIATTIGFGLRPLFLTSFAAQVVLSVIAGFGYVMVAAILAPTMMQWFGHKSAHVYIGVGSGFFFIGAGLGILLTSSLLSVTGTVGTFGIWSGILVVATALWWLFARDRSTGQTHEKTRFADEFGKVMRTRSSRVNLVFAILLSGVSVFVMDFLPVQMVVVRTLPLAMAGLIAGLFAIAMGFGLAVLPSLAGNRSKKVTALLLLTAALVVWLIYMILPSWSVASLIVFALVCGFVFEAPWALGLSLQESMPGVTPQNVGVAAGIWTMAVDFGVFVVPLILGAIQDHFKMPGGTWSILITYLLGLIALLFVGVDAKSET